MAQGNDDPNLESDVSEGEEEIEHGETNGQLHNRMTKLEENNQMLQLLADPDIKKVHDLKRAGKPVNVSEAAHGNESEEESEPDPLEEVTKDLAEDDPVRGMLNKVNTLLDRRLGKGMKAIEELSSRVQGVEGVAGDVARKEVKEQVNAAKAKYKDFAQFKNEIMDVANKVPGISVEEAYILAKSRSGKLKLNEGTTHSEKPTSQPRSRSTGKPTTQARPQGRLGFKTFLGEALSGLNTDSE